MSVELKRSPVNGITEQQIVAKLLDTFQPQVLHIENESHKHSSGKGSESHFKVTLVAEQFNAKRSVARHQAVYQCLKHELETSVHALALHLYTPAEWLENAGVVPASPNCAGIGH